MYYIIQITFLIVLALFAVGKSKLYKMFVLLHVLAFVFAIMLDSHKINEEDLLSLVYILFTDVLLFLVIFPWRNVRIKEIRINQPRFNAFFEKSLIAVLVITMLINIIVAVIIVTTIPDVSEYKLKDGWKELYDSIPGFALLNRVSYITQYMGYFALPYAFYFFSKRNIKRGALFFFLSASSLMAGIAQYSRAQMLIYMLCLSANFIVFENLFDIDIQKKIRKISLRVVLALGIVFLYTTINRFSSSNMDYYSDRIPKTSLIQDPVTYSFMDYMSMGFPNGVNLMRYYTPDKNFKGEDFFYYPLLFLDYFGIINWDGPAFEEKREKVFRYDGGEFHGYACGLLYNFGFIIPIILGLLYFAFITKSINKPYINISKSLLVAFLVIEPSTSIFYCGVGIYAFPLAFYILTKIYYSIFRSNPPKRIHSETENRNIV